MRYYNITINFQTEDYDTVTRKIQYKLKPTDVEIVYNWEIETFIADLLTEDEKNHFLDIEDFEYIEDDEINPEFPSFKELVAFIKSNPLNYNNVKERIDSVLKFHNLIEGIDYKWGEGDDIHSIQYKGDDFAFGCRDAGFSCWDCHDGFRRLSGLFREAKINY